MTSDNYGTSERKAALRWGAKELVLGAGLLYGATRIVPTHAEAEVFLPYESPGYVALRANERAHSQLDSILSAPASVHTREAAGEVVYTIVATKDKPQVHAAYRLREQLRHKTYGAMFVGMLGATFALAAPLSVVSQFRQIRRMEHRELQRQQRLDAE